MTHRYKTSAKYGLTKTKELITMIYFTSVIPANVCLAVAGYGWVNGVSGWGWWLLGVFLLVPSVSQMTMESE